jgi:alkylhydroperoxidase/carboxymuconolactone decarboxylase family protein YurZ
MARRKQVNRSTPGRPDTKDLPGRYLQFVAEYPELGQAHEAVAQAVEAVAHLDEKTAALIKVGICAGAQLESALRSHVRRALKAGVGQDEIMQAILLGMNTIGFPRTVAAWSWAKAQFERGI